MAVDFFYSIPNALLLLLFIVVLVSMSLCGLLIITILGLNTRTNNESIHIYTGILAVVIGVIIAFIISSEWQQYHDASTNTVTEADVLYLLYQTFDALPGTDDITDTIGQYICNIINVQFPAMKLGQIPATDEILNELQILIYVYDPPDTAKDNMLYSNGLSLFNQAVFLGTQRLQSSTMGLADELWWVMVFGFVILMIMSWWLSGSMWLRTIMTIFITGGYAAILFLAVALDYPFRGDLSVSSAPFQFVLQQLNITCQ